MRNPRRIPLILDKIDMKEFLTSIGFSEIMADRFMPKIIDNFEEIREYWEDYPDQRLVQVLLNLHLITDPGHYYELEETDWMIKKGYFLPQELIWWGTYGKSGKEPLKWIRIKDMETDHLEACLRLNREEKMRIWKEAKDAMEDELGRREDDSQFEDDFENENLYIQKTKNNMNHIKTFESYCKIQKNR